MFFIFGWGHQTVKNHGPVKVFHCEHCNNDKVWILHSRKTWFTLFFIPVIPYSSEHLLFCPICHHGVRLDNEKFNELRLIAECNTELIGKKITEEQHAQRIEKIASDINSNNVNSNIYPKTETQLNYIRQMNEINNQKNSGSE
ncbi:zinc ribbon family protein [Ruminiclostridium sufflavum DSM 19573]|uniref:Zinc ribbon family protein n=1 Tax=Ruminiclostridium sufflavum DSM 19573 TaxID=1121337 RepID=A0A318XJP3_9FIRM|nr:zinc-ribbon domain-containing protein [Ruminiclostridium sufflavum]PYG85627.1 zinc ribbon family protein [Ruminiclostridium sufflavum DSM 19573]